MAQRLTEQKAKLNRIGELGMKLEGLRLLRQCFGPHGVRQILMDAVAPELEAIADDLFQRATDGQQRLRIATQTANKDGSLAETFDILIQDGRGERDVLEHSGGELQLIRILFRIAVVLWIGRLRGQKADCLFLDEAFDQLGTKGTNEMLAILEYLRDHFGLIVVITHDPAIGSRLGSMVWLDKGMSGVHLTVRDNNASTPVLC